MKGVPGVPRDVVVLFDHFAHQLARAGFTRYSARAILHRIRWHHHVERGNRTFKCNNLWTPAMARAWLAENPQYPGFFETRASPGGSHDDDE
jgi:hypothetical protein